MRLLLDEHLSRRVAQVLRTRGHDVVCVTEVGLEEKEDHEVWEWAIANHRCMVSYNARHFAKLFAELFHRGVRHPGLVLIQAKTIPQLDTGLQIRALDLVLSQDPNLTDQLIFLDRP